MAFTVQPSGGVAGTPFTAQPEVAVLDHFGNTVTDYKGSVTMSIAYGSTSGAVLSGSTTVPVSGSVARFTDLSINKTYPSYNLIAMSDSLEPANSLSFEVTPGKAVKLEFTIQPSGAKTGTIFDTQPKVAVEDTYENVVHNTGISVTVSITPGSGTSGAVLPGIKSEIAEGGLGGLAEYSTFRSPGPVRLLLTAVGGNLTPGVSQKFDVTP